MNKIRKYYYPVLPDLSEATGMAQMPLSWEYMIEYARLKYEQGADRDKIKELIDGVMEKIRETSVQLQELPDDAFLRAREPDDYEHIVKLRPADRSRIVYRFEEKEYLNKLRGALCGRFAGCTLGAPVEFWNVSDMQEWAAYCCQEFPPIEYWRKTKTPNALRYEVSTFEEYERDKLNKVPVDDDVTYTILGLVVLEKYGLGFKTEEAGRIWTLCLPRACTAEEVVLNHLKNGLPAETAGETDNPYRQWIGADIRADAWGYVMPGMPEKAAKLAYRDAYLTHRRNGIYGEMYFSAVIAAAFASGEGVDTKEERTIFTMEDALRAGLEQIPEECLLASDLKWAICEAAEICDYKQARAAVEEYFGEMSGVHTNLNACLTVFGLLMGKGDFTKVVGEITAMGYDNDCNAATAGSIFGAFYGLNAIPGKWYECFNDEVYTYLEGYHCLKISDVCERFMKFAKEAVESIK